VLEAAVKKSWFGHVQRMEDPRTAKQMHSIGFLMKSESEVDHASPGEAQSGEM